MPKPLSIWKYYQANRRKVNVVFMITFLCIFLQCAISVYTASVLHLTYGNLLEIYNSLTFISTNNAAPEYQERLINRLKKHPNIAKATPCALKSLSFSIPICSCTVIYVETSEFMPLLQTLNLKLVQGRLPAPGSRDIVLHWRIAANKGLKIGDRVNRSVFPTDSLAGEYRLSGILDGKAIIGFADLNPYCRDYRVPKACLEALVRPKPGQIQPLKEYLEQLAQQNLCLYLQTTAEKFSIKFCDQVLLMVNIIHVIITGILTICAGFLLYLYFYQRRSEFGLLEALGHTRQMIVGRSFIEILTLNLLGFGSALTLFFLSSWALNHFLLQAQGLTLTIWKPSFIFQLLSTPLFATCCALMPVWRMLKKVDPIAIIEGQDQVNSFQKPRRAKPLSILNFLVSNPRQTGVVFILVFLSIVLEGALLIYVSSILKQLHRTGNEPLKAIAFTGYQINTAQKRVKQARLRQTLTQHPAVAETTPFNLISTSMNGVGSPLIFLPDAKRIRPLMNLMGLRLIRGRLPKPGAREIILHWELAANKGLKIGDPFGSLTQKQELLAGKYRLVGLYDGEAILGFADLDRYVKDLGFTREDCGLLVIPKKGQLVKMKQYLSQLRRKDPSIYDSTLYEEGSRTTVALFVMALLTVYYALTVIIALCVSFLFYLYFYKRRSEFGMLEALGYNRKIIVKRALQEITGISLSSFCVGLAVAFLGGWFLNRMLLIKYGIPLVLWDAGYPGKLLPIPLLITLCSIIPVWRLLVKVDPIALLEGEE